MKGRDKKSVRTCKTVKQFERAVRKQGGKRSDGGKHPHFNHPDGGSAPFPDHRGDMDKGTRFSLIKLLLALGFTAFPLCLVIWLACGLASMY